MRKFTLTYLLIFISACANMEAPLKNDGKDSMREKVISCGNNFSLYVQQKIIDDYDNLKTNGAVNIGLADKLAYWLNQQLPEKIREEKIIEFKNCINSK